MKLAHKLDAPDAQLLERATTTIVNQVTSLKHMVDDFREYARCRRWPWRRLISMIWWAMS